MNEDNNMIGSMARDALTGVNGGASVMTPAVATPDVPNIGAVGPTAFGAPAGAASPVRRQMMSAYDLAKRTVANLSRGLARPAQGQFGQGAAIQDGAQQMQNPAGAAGLLSAVLGRQPAQPRPETLPEIDVRPASERVTMMRPVGGGASIPHYDYNGVSVALPDGVDANDANAVSAAMAEQNALIDMMNGLNDEED